MVLTKKWPWPVVTVITTTALYVAAFPPLNIPECAYFWAVPFILWAFYKPAFKLYFSSALITGFTSWVILIWWLRHVTYLGTLALSFVLGLFLAFWLSAVRWTLPQLEGKGLGKHFSGLLGLAGLWVLLEHVREFLFTGFPWLPLAASQWDRPALLQIIAFTGYTGVSFVLVFFNLGLASYLRRLTTRPLLPAWYERICPEFYSALFLLLGAASSIFWVGTFKQNRQSLFQAAVVQPYIQQSLKWDPDKALNNLEILERETLNASAKGGEVIFWPESVTPWPIKGHEGAQAWAEDLVHRLGKPLLMGNMAVEAKTWYNIICAVTPEEGFVEPYYAKRKLVPFGEYVPLQRFLPFLKKVVPLDGSFKRGQRAQLIPIKIANTLYRVGALVCYEDTFPHLARSMVKAGADFIFVATNNAWYGEEGGAYQHAAHSVLRAVETRRPVIRCGNGGWSGWVDEYGNVRHMLSRPKNGIYFRGSDRIEVSRDSRWVRRESFYLRYGDWFVILCAFLVIGGYFSILFSTMKK